MSQNIFNVVKSKVSIIEVIGLYTELKKDGTYFKGESPFPADVYVDEIPAEIFMEIYN